MSLIKTGNYVLYLGTIKYDQESKYVAIKTNPKPRTRSELTQSSYPPTRTCNDSDLVAFNHHLMALSLTLLQQCLITHTGTIHGMVPVRRFGVVYLQSLVGDRVRQLGEFIMLLLVLHGELGRKSAD